MRKTFFTLKSVVENSWTAEFTGCHWETMEDGIWLSGTQGIIPVKRTFKVCYPQAHTFSDDVIIHCGSLIHQIQILQIEVGILPFNFYTIMKLVITWPREGCKYFLLSEYISKMTNRINGLRNSFWLVMENSILWLHW